MITHAYLKYAMALLMEENELDYEVPQEYKKILK